MLIINADDLGRDTVSTDTCLDCFRRKRITSASLMVFMADSARAAERARSENLETGLHFNLVMPFEDAAISDRAREVHETTTRFFRRGPWTQVIYNPLITKAVAASFNSQLEEFRRLFGRDPAHINGHKHFHLSLNVVCGGVLPAGAAVRRSFTFSKGEKKLLNRWYRRAVDAWLLKQHISSDAFFSLKPVNDLVRLERIFSLSRTSCVELMVHTWSPDQYAFLIGERFLQMAESVELGGFLALRSLR
jgi:predicted glycoside hydrolase/deacetylase ChbG (UPF0249 family)